MCRLLAYWGPPARAASLVVDPPHGLLTQCTAAREQTSGHENPDGWGFGWFPAGGDRPERYRTHHADAGRRRRAGPSAPS